jgi:type I restriction enzyme, S subunit
MSGYKPYPKYKESGVEWLGEVPEHWMVTYFQRCVAISEGQVDPEKDEYMSMTLIGPNHIDSGTGRILELETATAQGAESGKYFCHKGDVVYSKIRPALRKVCIAPTDCLCSADMYPLSGFNGMSNGFLFWFILSEPFSAFAVLESDRVAMPKINRETLKSLSIPLPPILDQEAIYTFLDRETSKLDILIREQKELITLLQEKRLALISNAVTKGLNHKAKMKDSGVEWLGEVPEHWELKRLRRLCSITTGGKDTENRIDDGAYPFFVRSQEVERIDSFSFNGEGILTAGDGVGVAKVFHYYFGKFDFHQRVYLLYDFKKELVGQFLFEYIREHFHKEVLKLSAKSTVDSLRMPMFQDFPVLVPPIPEQQAILSFLKIEISKLDALIKEAEETNDLMHEHRASLISEAVTGKIDVRKQA